MSSVTAPAAFSSRADSASSGWQSSALSPRLTTLMMTQMAMVLVLHINLLLHLMKIQKKILILQMIQKVHQMKEEVILLTQVKIPQNQMKLHQKVVMVIHLILQVLTMVIQLILMVKGIIKNQIPAKLLMI